MKPTKICCFCERWESGGIESFLYNVLLYVSKQSHQVDIVAAELTDSIFTESLRQHGIRFIKLSGKQQNLWANHSAFRQLLRVEQYDVVHLNIFHGLSLYYAYLARQAGVPVRIAHSHNTMLRQSRTRPLKQLLHQMARSLFTNSATDLWACSAQAAGFLFSRKAIEKKGFQFIPNGIHVERFQFHPAIRNRVREELGIQKKFVIGNVGRLCYQKNQDFLLDVLAEVICREPQACLLLVGEGEEETKLRKKAALLGISDAVIFYGTSPCVEQLLWAMDVFAFPSRFEGLGIAVVEAQAAGLPVLCSEQIPCEAHVTQILQALPLETGAKAWAESLLALEVPMDRENRAVEVKNAGFDIADTAERVEAYYMRKQPNGQA